MGIARNGIMAEKVDDAGIQPTRGASADADTFKTHRNVVEHAKSATQKEQSMSLLQGIKLYPKAIFFSIIISTTIVMVRRPGSHEAGV